MKVIKELMIISLPILSLSFLTSCAAGAATAGYALKAQSADGLTAEAEQRIINRAKAELMADIPIQQRYYAPSQCSPDQQ